MKKIAYILPIIIIAAFVSLSFNQQKVHANPSVFSTTACRTSTATTSPEYLQPGLATSTLTCNTTLIAKGPDALDSAVLLMSTYASSSIQTTYNYVYQYSQDGIDWSNDHFSMPATTTAILPYGLVYKFGPQTATGTVVRTDGISTSSLMRTVVNVPTPTKWVRIAVSLPIGSNNGAFWGQLVGKSETLH